MHGGGTSRMSRDRVAVLGRRDHPLHKDTTDPRIYVADDLGYIDAMYDHTITSSVVILLRRRLILFALVIL
jgi:hypothetical protein